MQWLMKICARGALGLGAAALLLSGIPAYANPAAPSPEGQPRLLAQAKAQPGEAEKLEQQRLKEQQDRAKSQAEKQQQSQPRMRKMRGAVPAPGPMSGGGAGPNQAGRDLAPGLSARMRNPLTKNRNRTAL